RIEPAVLTAGTVVREVGPVHDRHGGGKALDFLRVVATDDDLLDPGTLGEFDLPINGGIRRQHQDDRLRRRADFDAYRPPVAGLRLVDADDVQLGVGQWGFVVRRPGPVGPFRFRTVRPGL